jgi:hypothetical protein
VYSFAEDVSKVRAQSTLLVVADDLKVSPHDSIWHVEIALYADHKGSGEMGYFTSPRFENLGGRSYIWGVFLRFGNRGLEYEFQIFDTLCVDQH